MATAGLAALLATNLSLADAFHVRLAATGGSLGWSEATYELDDILRTEHAGEPVALLDWGFQNALGFLGHDTLELHAVHWWIGDRSTPDSRIRDLLLDPNYVFVRRADRFTDKTAASRVQAVAATVPGLVVNERKIYQRDGEHALSVLKFSVSGDRLDTLARTGVEGSPTATQPESLRSAVR
jgi:hypothetical protein